MIELKSQLGDTIESDNLWENPMGTNGFEFIEFTAPDPVILEDLFSKLGFAPIARHRSKNVTLWRQGGINFIINGETTGFPADFAGKHGPSINAFALRVDDAAKVLNHAATEGVKVLEGSVGPMELNIPALEGVGGSLLYLVDRYREASIYDIDFNYIEGMEHNPAGYGLNYIDHLTHNVYQGHMDDWANLYERVFNFKEVRFFEIEGKVTGLKSRAMTSPCGKIRIPINEESSVGKKGQIAEYLDQYHGEGVQHVALSSTDIVSSVEQIRTCGVAFLETPDTYYELVDSRLPGHGVDLGPLKKNGVLIDGFPAEGKGLLLQIFTECMLGPIFIELIERRGNDGFGEGNFKALFESMELDQIRRGVVDAE